MRLIKSLAKKPTMPQFRKDEEGKSERQDPTPKRADPFLPPFEEGLFIADLSKTHCLLFNKFCICKEHTLVVTKEMERQDAPLTEEDFTAIIYAMQSLEAFVFFNRGTLSGMSILHKHF